MFMHDSGSNSQYARSSLDAGDLARSLSCAEIEAALARREAVLRAASGAAERFLGGNWRDDLPDLLCELGQGADVSRTYLFENQTNTDGEIRHFQRYEWCAEGIEPQIDNPILQNFALADIGLGRWAQKLECDAIVQGDIAALPTSERPSLEEQNIISILVVPITVNGQWWGFIGFDECRTARVWRAAEIETLRLSADITAAAIARENSDAALRESESEMAALFDAMRDPVFVMDSAGIYRKIFAHDESLLARPPHELIGCSLIDVFGPEIGAQFQGVVDQVMQSGQLLSVEYPMTINGQEKWFSARITPLKEGGVLWIVHDDTESHNAREEMRQREELFRLLAENSSDCSRCCNSRPTYASPSNATSSGFIISPSSDSMMAPSSASRR